MVSCTSFAFALPPEANVLGIEATFRRKARDSPSKVTDGAVRIVKAGQIGSVDKSLPGNWPAIFGHYSYGGPADLWGGSWTAADINSGDFGVALSMAWTGSSGNDDGFIDHVSVTVRYQLCP